MSSRRFALLLAASAALAGILLTGCGARSESSDDHAHEHDEARAEPHQEHGHGGEHADDPDAHASFRADEGLRLSADAAAALDITVATVEVRRIRPVLELSASVFAPGPPARASALVPLEIAEQLDRAPPSGETRVVSVRRSLASALAHAEIVLSLPGTHRVGSTVPVTVRGAEREALVVPKTALLRSATGTFVYRANDEAFRRTPVQTGATDGEWVEIVEGLRPGDTVVARDVESLWLIELRLTKGGGHSH